MKESLKFLVIGDLHGEMPKVHVDMTSIDAIIAPGDVCGDDIRPYMLKLIEERTKKEGKVDFRKILSKKKEESLEKKSIEKGRKVLEFLNSFSKPVFIVPGNWDLTEFRDGIPNDENVAWDEIKKDLPFIIDIEHKATIFNGINIIGHGSTSAPEPLKQIPPEEFEDEEDFTQYVMRYHYFSGVHSHLQQLFEESEGPILFLTHNVPYDTKLDIVKAKKSYANGKHYGSVLARKLIDEFEPMLCIGGHIHEGYGKEKIKKTLCINSGFGSDVNTIVEINVKKGKVKKVEFLGKNKENH